ncbi:MAG: hypothetical protein V7739_21215 [Motiliproteus sp.]
MMSPNDSKHGLREVFSKSQPEAFRPGFKACCGRTFPDLKYAIFLPDEINAQTPVLVSVHGVSRNVEEHLEAFSAICKQMGWLLVVPQFSRKNFPAYQTLGIRRKQPGPRSDLALNSILDEIQQDLGIETRRFRMFGFSGGAQFVHRYALAHPHRVMSAVLGASGWYTFPDHQTPYPRGYRTGADSDLRLFSEKMLTIPMAVLVGSEDISRDDALNQTDKIDLQQGINRVERGKNWVSAMQFQAKKRGLPTQYIAEIMSGCDHDFGRCVEQGKMHQKAVKFFLHVTLAEMGGALRSTQGKARFVPFVI